MPEGRIIAALHDGKAGEYLAVSQPLSVVGHKTSLLELRPPVEGTDLVVKLERPDFITDIDEFDVEPTVALDDGEPLSPDVLVPTPDRLYAVWYGLGGRYAHLEVSSPSVYIEAQDIPLRPRRVESFSGMLSLLPNLDVTLELPPEHEPDRLVVKIETRAEGRSLRQAELEPGERLLRIVALPPEPLRVTLEASPWELEEEIDLTDGLDHQVRFRLRPISVSGTVYFGNEEHPAIVTFQTTRRKANTGFLVVETDAQGFYRTFFLQPGRYNVAIQLDGPDGPRFMDAQTIPDDMTLDFRLPANRYLVHVVDEASNEAVPEARVSYTSRWQPDDGSRRSSGTYVMADERGVAKLPPLRPGKLEFEVSVDGYLPSGLRTVDVGKDEGARELKVALKRVGETIDLRLLLPAGAPARQAMAVIVPDLSGSPALWQGTADATGRVAVPERLQDFLILVRHPESGFLIRRWRVSGEPPVEWSMPTAAPPLVVRTVLPSGEPVSAILGLMVDGHRITGPMLSGLVGASSNSSNARGAWIARSLPASPVTVVAWADPASEPRFWNGLLDSLAVTVGYPWPETVDVPVAD